MRTSLIVALAVVGCAHQPADDARYAGPAVDDRALMGIPLAKADPPLQCIEVGTDYEMIVWGDFEGARRKLRRKAWERGGNYVRLEMPAGGTIYRCPAQTTAQAAAMSPPATMPPQVGVRLMKSDPPPSCTEVGAVAEAIWFNDVEGARARLKQKAQAMGANFVRLELPTTGTAFRCP